ncbi:hypothetical protein MTO96_019861 [Rhipicephalus appendiculatus]
MVQSGQHETRWRKGGGGTTVAAVAAVYGCRRRSRACQMRRRVGRKRRKTRRRRLTGNKWRLAARPASFKLGFTAAPPPWSGFAGRAVGRVGLTMAPRLGGVRLYTDAAAAGSGSPKALSSSTVRATPRRWRVCVYVCSFVCAT